MAIQALIFVLETLLHLFALALLLRFYAQMLNAPFRARAGNPLVNFVSALTDWIVLPARRLVPSLFKLDMASLLVAWIVVTLLAFLTFLLRGIAAIEQPVFWSALFFLGLVDLLRQSLYLLFGVLVVAAILSWVNPYHPLQPFFGTLARPFLKPIQRIIPLIGGVDLSPLFLCLVIQVILGFPVQSLMVRLTIFIAQIAS